MQNIKNIVFDFGGTIDNGGKSWRSRFYNLWKRNQLNTDFNDFNKAFSYVEERLLYEIQSKNISSFDKLIKSHVELQKAYYLKYVANTKMDKGLVFSKFELIYSVFYSNFIHKLHINKKHLLKLNSHYNLYIVSNFFGILTKCLNKEKMDFLFKDIIDSHTVAVRKPNKKIYKILIDRNKIIPEESIFIGDSYVNDILIPQSLGFMTIYINPQTIDDFKGTFHFDSLYKVKKFLQK